MKLVSDPAFGEVDLSASAEELTRLANMVASGRGFISATFPPGGKTLASIEVTDATGPGVLVHLDADRQVLVISGDSGGRAVLADNLHAMAGDENGGHLHIDYFPGHWYLVEGSVPLVVNSPHGGMPSH
ncbi:Imm32 family immunity protein [Yinghuangia soli]|uniref:Uncharacterized protein n=1 Tax=Yinghuangia soli TaxID=2908204 RepID=A0AA41Q6S3_9ACTN|nr:hypothetical protein [Yinghuangia soli]MCF2532252.1 hypothetical protein [Yinghuangia soli]